MAKVLHQTARATTAQAASSIIYYFAGGGPSLIGSATQANRQVITRMVFTMSKLYINVVANDRGATTLRVQKNGLNANEVASITASTTGKFEDVVNTDTTASGDLFSYMLFTGAGGTTFVFDVMSHISTPGSGTFQRLVVNVSANLANNEIFPISGSVSGSTETSMQTKIYGTSGVGGTFKNAAVFSNINTRDGACTVTFRKNAVSQAMVCTIPALTAGTFEDLVNTVTTANGDLVNWIIGVGGASGNCQVQYIGVTYETTDNTFLLNGFGSMTVLVTTTVYVPFTGSTSANVATESEAHAEARFVYKIRNLRTWLTANSLTAASTIRLRRNAANANLNVSIPALTTGAFEDTVNIDGTNPTELLDSQLVAGATGVSMGVRNITYEAASQEGFGGSTLLLMGVG